MAVKEVTPRELSLLRELQGGALGEGEWPSASIACPLCGAPFQRSAMYREHLDVIHAHWKEG